MTRPPKLDDIAEARFWVGVEQAGKFFLGDADVQKALNKLVRVLDGSGIAYAIVGALALNEFGYRRSRVCSS